MGSAAGGKLAAVTNAGGLGMIGSGYASMKAIKQELTEAGNARVGIGFILWALDRNPTALDVALEAQPAAVMLSFGDPTPYTGRIKAAGCRIICQVQTLAQAKEALLLDAVAAEGRGLGCGRLVLDTALDNVLAHRFYYRQGLLARALRFSRDIAR